MKWINVKEQVPNHTDNVLVTDQKETWIGSYNSNLKWGVVYNGAPPLKSQNITHWMELPNPIKGYADTAS